MKLIAVSAKFKVEGMTDNNQVLGFSSGHYEILQYFIQPGLIKDKQLTDVS